MGFTTFFLPMAFFFKCFSYFYVHHKLNSPYWFRLMITYSSLFKPFSIVDAGFPRGGDEAGSRMNIILGIL